MTTIRQAVAADLDAIRELNLELFRKEFAEFDKTLDCSYPASSAGREYFAHRISAVDGCALVAEDDGRVVGYLAGGFRQTEPYRLDFGPLAELETMFVEEPRRNQKIGAGLMAGFIGWCRENKIARIRVAASPGNTAGIRFYQRHGFAPLDLVLEKAL